MSKFYKVTSLLIAILLAFTLLCGCDITIPDGFFDGLGGGTNQYKLNTSAQVSYDQVTTANVAEVVANISLQYTYEVYCEISYSYVESTWFGSAQTQTGSQTNQGTAFCINEDGYLITNAHVICVEDSALYTNFAITSRDIYVNLYYMDTDDMMPCTIVAYDEVLDLAVLKIDSNGVYFGGGAYQIQEDFPYATFFAHQDPTKDSSTVLLNYGEFAVAVGNANGYGIAVTTGVVSAPFRYFEDANNVYVKAVQTDAAINPGNSGGPLLNAYAGVIGVNSFKIVEDATEGMGYAIPTYEVLKFVDSLSNGSYDKYNTKGGTNNLYVGSFVGITNPIVYYTTTQRAYVKQ